MQLASGIDVGQRMNVGSGKFGKNDKRRAFSKRRARKIWPILTPKSICSLKPIFVFLSFNPKFNSFKVLNKIVGSGKSPKSINVGPSFIPDYKVPTYDIRPRMFQPIVFNLLCVFTFSVVSKKKYGEIRSNKVSYEPNFWG